MAGLARYCSTFEEISAAQVEQANLGTNAEYNSSAQAAHFNCSLILDRIGRKHASQCPQCQKADAAYDTFFQPKEGRLLPMRQVVHG